MKKTIFLLLFILLYSQVSAIDRSPSFSLSAGLTLDIAPFGIEKIYISLQGQILSEGPFSFGFKPSVGLSRDSLFLRLPAIIGYNFKWFFPYGGAGIELASHSGDTRISPFVTGGAQLFLKPFFIDLPVVATLKKYDNSYDIDTDISLLAGVYFPF